MRVFAAIVLFLSALCHPAFAREYAMPAAVSFVPIDLAGHVGGLEPVLTIRVGGETKIYPLRILALHGVINDTVGGISLALSYCGPCGTVGAYQTQGQMLRAYMEDDQQEMDLVNMKGARWAQATGEPLGTRQALLKAVPATVVSMARARQAVDAGDLVLVLQDTDRSRIPIPKTLALPGQTPASQTDFDDTTANTTKVLDARSWSLDVLSPERRLTGEDRLILLETPQGGIQGPPAPR